MTTGAVKQPAARRSTADTPFGAKCAWTTSNGPQRSQPRASGISRRLSACRPRRATFSVRSIDATVRGGCPAAADAGDDAREGSRGDGRTSEHALEEAKLLDPLVSGRVGGLLSEDREIVTAFEEASELTDDEQLRDHRELGQDKRDAHQPVLSAALEARTRVNAVLYATAAL